MRLTRKRSFKGNKHTSSGEDVMNQQTEQEGENTNVVPSSEQSVSVPSIEDALSSSASKIDLSCYDSMKERGYC